MPQINRCRRNPTGPAKPAATAAVAILLACFGLAACGGSSKASPASANAAATAATPGGGTGPTGPLAGRFKALRECLQKSGITLPQRPPGARRPPGSGGFLGGGTGPQLPKGVTRAQYRAALQKCGAGTFAGRPRLNNPAYQQALAKFATCMREHGVNVPKPNTSGTGPVFSTKGLNTSSPQFAAAEAKCRSELPPFFQRRPGARGVPPRGRE